MKTYRRLLIWAASLAAAVLLLATAGLAVLSRRLSEPGFKARAEKSASELLGKTLTIGKIERSRLFPLVVSAREVVLTEKDGTTAVRCPEVALKISPLSLLKFKVGVEEVRFVSPEVTLPMLGVPDHPAAAAAPVEGRRRLFGLLFNRFVVENGRLRYSDARRPLLLDGRGDVRLSPYGFRFPFSITVLQDPEEGKGILRLSGSLGGRQPLLDAAYQSPASEFSVQVEFPPGAPGVQLSVTGARLDVDEAASWIAALGPAAGKKDKGEPSRVSGSVSLGTVTFSGKGESLEAVRFRFRRAEETFVVSDFEARGLGGTLSGSAEIAPPAVRARGRAAGVDAARLFRVFGSSGDISGICELDVSLSSELGPAFLKKLTGKVGVRITEGRLPEAPGILKLLSAANVLSLVDHLKKQKSGSRKGIPVKEAKGEIKISGGTASAEEYFYVENDVLQVGFKGTVRFLEKTIDGDVVIRVLTVADELITKVPGLRDILLGDGKSFFLIWVRLKGPLEDPKVRVLPLKSITSPLWDTAGRIFRLPKDLLEKARGGKR